MITIHDLYGKVIRKLSVYKGISSISWDGTDGNGITVNDGAYYVLLMLDGSTVTNKLLVLKNK